MSTMDYGDEYLIRITSTANRPARCHVRVSEWKLLRRRLAFWSSFWFAFAAIGLITLHFYDPFTNITLHMQ